MKLKLISLKITLALLIATGLLHSSLYSLSSSSSTISVISKVYADAVSNVSLTYEDQLHGFKFDYPAHWDQTLANNTKNTGVAIDLENFTHLAPSGVSVYTQSLQDINQILQQNNERPQEDNETHQENNESSDEENEKPPEITTLKQYFNNFIYSEYCCVDFKSIKFNNSTLGGLPSMNASWNHVDENKTIIGKNWLNFAINDGLAYVVYYHTPTEESFNKFLPEVKSIINSFQVIIKVEPVSLPLEAYRYLI